MLPNCRYSVGARAHTPSEVMRKTEVRSESPKAAGEMLLVGSMPFDTVEDVFRECGSILGDCLASLPDGEVGDRRNWTEVPGLAHIRTP